MKVLSGENTMQHQYTNMIKVVMRHNNFNSLNFKKFIHQSLPILIRIDQQTANFSRYISTLIN